MYSPDNFDETPLIPSSSTSFVAADKSTTGVDVISTVVSEPWGNILNLALGNTVDSASFPFNPDTWVIQGERTGAVLLTFKKLSLNMVRIRNNAQFIQMYYNLSFVMQTDRWRPTKMGYGITITAKTAKDGAVIVDACSDVDFERAPCNTDRPYNISTRSIYEDYYDSVNYISLSFNSGTFYHNNC